MCHSSIWASYFILNIKYYSECSAALVATLAYFPDVAAFYFFSTKSLWFGLLKSQVPLFGLPLGSIGSQRGGDSSEQVSEFPVMSPDSLASMVYLPLMGSVAASHYSMLKAAHCNAIWEACTHSFHVASTWTQQFMVENLFMKPGFVMWSFDHKSLNRYR